MSMNGGLMPIRINVAVVANLKVERCVSCGQRMIPLIRIKMSAAKASLLANQPYSVVGRFVTILQRQ